MNKKRILIIDNEETVHVALKYLLKGQYEFRSAYNSPEAEIILKNHTIDLILLDLNIESENDGLQLLPKLKKLESDLDVVILSSNKEIPTAMKAIQLGAAGYVVKDHANDQLQITIESTLEKRRLISRNSHHKKSRQRNLDSNPIIGVSPKIKNLCEEIEKLKNTNVSVIIQGESGTGKELVAQHLAQNSTPFVTVDSATITSSMAESTLFGHEAGAFTGANQRTRGLFEEANEGTIYFDEISNLPKEIQPKLLRVLQEKEIIRLGSTKRIPLSFRVICATNKNLDSLVSSGEFKFDLLQRLNVVTLYVPALRERTEDIPALCSHFLNLFKTNESPREFSKAALQALSLYSWPGNIRELSNLIAGLCVTLDKETIEAADLPEKVLEKNSSSETTLQAQMKRHEKLILKRHYSELGHNLSKMSRRLGISRSQLYAKLRTHNIH